MRVHRIAAAAAENGDPQRAPLLGRIRKGRGRAKAQERQRGEAAHQPAAGHRRKMLQRGHGSGLSLSFSIVHVVPMPRATWAIPEDADCGWSDTQTARSPSTSPPNVRKARSASAREKEWV